MAKRRSSVFDIRYTFPSDTRPKVSIRVQGNLLNPGSDPQSWFEDYIVLYLRNR